MSVLLSVFLSVCVCVCVCVGLSLCVYRMEATRCAPAKSTVSTVRALMMSMTIMLPTGKSLVLFFYLHIFINFFYIFFCAVRVHARSGELTW